MSTQDIPSETAAPEAGPAAEPPSTVHPAEPPSTVHPAEPPGTVHPAEPPGTIHPAEPPVFMPEPPVTASFPPDLLARIAALEAELGEMRDRWLRSEAEIANVRARARRDVDETRQYAVQKFARDVVEAAENLKRGLDNIPPARDGEPDVVARLRDGFAGVERSFVALLERNGIHRDDPTGASFDANLHQAMAEQESSDHPPGTIIQAWTAAWTLNGRLLRPAMVVVAKAPPAELFAPAAAAPGSPGEE